MTILELLQFNPLVHAIGMTLLNFVWQGLLIALVLSAILSLLRRATPQLRYLLSCLALLLMFLFPIVTFSYLYASSDLKRPPVVPETVFTLLEVADERDRVAEKQAAIAASEAVEGTAELAAMPSSEAAPIPAEVPVAATFDFSTLRSKLILLCNIFAPWCAVLWGLGVLLLSIRLMGGLYFSSTLKKRYAERIGGKWQRHVDLLCEQLGITKAVTLLQSQRIAVPTMLGWLHPVILLPVSALTGLSPEQLEVLLVHELMHIRRYDYLVNLIQNVIETLLFYHPAVWWVSRRIRNERELCCDDGVLEVCGDTHLYVRALASMVDLRMQRPSMAIAADGGSLPNRIRRMLGLAEVTPHRISRGISGGVVLALLLGLYSLFALYDAVSEEPPSAEAEAIFEEAFALRAEILKKPKWQSDAWEMRQLLHGSMDRLEDLVLEYPEEDRFHCELGAAIYTLGRYGGFTKEERREVFDSAHLILGEGTKNYEEDTALRDYRYLFAGICDKNEERLNAFNALVAVAPHNSDYVIEQAEALQKIAKDQITLQQPYLETWVESWDRMTHAQRLEMEYGRPVTTAGWSGFRFEQGDFLLDIDRPARELIKQGRREEVKEFIRIPITYYEELAAEYPAYYNDLLYILQDCIPFLEDNGFTEQVRQLREKKISVQEMMTAASPDLLREYRNMAAVDFYGGPIVHYPVRVTTPGEYRLYLQMDAHDDSSCLVFVWIEELVDGPGGDISDVYDVYFYADRDSDFATGAWHGIGMFEREGARVPLVWSIPAPGTYTIRICGTHDGVALDALLFQQIDYPGPIEEGPDESTRTAEGVFLEKDGIILAEAEHFTARSPLKEKEWLVVPGEDAGDVPHKNFRGNGYLQVLPDSSPTAEEILAAPENDPENDQVWRARADLHFQQENYEEAFADMARALELTPEDPLAWEKRARYHRSLKQGDEAQKDYEQAIALDPENAQMWNELGELLYIVERQYEEAAAAYRKAVELDPNIVEFKFHLACAYRELKNYEKALTLFNECISLEPKNVNCWDALGKMYYKQRQYEEAVAVHRKAVELNPTSVASNGNLVAAYQQAGALDKTLAFISECIATSPKENYYLFTRGKIYVGMEEFQQAATDFEQCVTLNDSEYYAWYCLAMTYLATGDTAVYRDTCARMLACLGDTTDPNEAYFTAWTCTLLPDAIPNFEDPLRLARLAVVENEENHEYMKTLAMVLMRSGQAQAAVTLLKDTEPSEENPAYMWFIQAMAHAQVGEMDAARHYYDKAVANADEQRQGDPAWNRKLTLNLLQEETETLLDSASTEE